ncbi:unnamed protein product [Zymoseptoria tritici ST99CH_3D1]|nr:unnamed protein product [Zymoseptoria tritici ST99CH_3D1]
MLTAGAADSHNLRLAGDVHEEKAWPWLHENLFLLNGGKSQSRKPSLHHQNARPTSTAQDAKGSSISSPTSNNTHSPLSNTIENLVAYAANTAFSPDDRGIRRRYWESVSLQLADIFQDASKKSVVDPHRTLYQLAESFLTNFNSGWPILNHEQLDPDTHHPVLFLVVGAIGAMFGDALHRQYGTLMHERLRRLLSASLYDLEGPDEDLVWLAQARLLTQTAALYFGQHQGFSYAQHIAAITVAQLRRMGFFREPSPDGLLMAKLSKMSNEAELAHYKQAETRRRIAFGILRTDVYTSVLLSTRPLLSADEMKLTFPRSDSLWMNLEGLSPEAQLQAHQIENARCLQMPFSDLIRIFLDKAEPNPELGALGYELTMFGLQDAVWKFTQDPELFPRLTGHCLEEIDIAVSEHRESVPRPNGERIIPALAVGQIRRRMDELYAERARLLHALDSWSHAVNIAINNGTFMYHRGTLLSCLMLYHLSRLRLTAPLEWLHHISYRAAEPQTVDWHTHRKVEGWLRSAFAPQAAQQAWDVKWLIESELQRPKGDRAHFNFLAFCSLHHAAVVLWTVAGSGEMRPSTIPKAEIETFLTNCPSLFSQLSSLGGNSFEVAAYRLAGHRFPTVAEVGN